MCLRWSKATSASVSISARSGQPDRVRVRLAAAARPCARSRSRRSRPRRRRTAAGRAAAPGGGARPRRRRARTGRRRRPSVQRSTLARPVADERPAPDALALLGGLEQEGGAGAAQLEERGDGRLAVLEERVADRDEVVLGGERADLLERRADAEPVSCGRQRRRPREHLLGVGEREAAAAQQHGQVVEHVGGLLGHALVGLLAGRAGDLLGLLLDLLAHERRVGEQLRRCRSPGAPRRARRSCARAPGSTSCGAGGSSSPRWKQVRSPGVAGRARRARPARAARRRRSRSGSRAPPGCCPTSRPCATARRASGSTGAARRSRACAASASRVHVGEREHLARAPVLDHAGHQALLVVGDRGVVHADGGS